MFASVVCVNLPKKLDGTQIKKFVQLIAVNFSIILVFIRKGMVRSGINDVRRHQHCCTVCGEKTRDRMVCQD